ncbi:sodium/calcium exchanger 1 [Trichuris suis]|nr:sodium/calcium exchanger 1 [Trichuris suis]
MHSQRAYLSVAATAFILIVPAVAANCTNTLENNCRDGLLLPLWNPKDQLCLSDRILRGIAYMLALIYMFLGVSIAADRFMGAIEVITSQERTVALRKKDGSKVKIKVRIWNETVSNLTLMALGSSAPEILLSIIEICGNGFLAGDLGPNTIVGSAAFNMFMILAICVVAIPRNEVRKQLHLNVFLVTAIWSIFAYIWLYVILAVSSPGVIDVWEGLATFLMFPLTVLTAYMADRRISLKKFVPMRYRADMVGLRAFSSELELPKADEDGTVDLLKQKGRNFNIEEAEFEQQRREYLGILRQLRQQMPDAELSTLQEKATYELTKRAKKSRAFYRVQATRRLIGDGNILEKSVKETTSRLKKRSSAIKPKQTSTTCKVSFNPCHYTVLENVGTVRVRVERCGGRPDLTVTVDYRTEDGTATAGSDYVANRGTLTMGPNCFEAFIDITIIDDDIFEEDEHFYIFLDNLRVKSREGFPVNPETVATARLAMLETPSIATVMILDDDHPGVFSFENDTYEVSEVAGGVIIKVLRHTGCRGKVLVPYETADGTGKAGIDYEPMEGALLFEDEEIEKSLQIGIVNKEQYERNEYFVVSLSKPVKLNASTFDEKYTGGEKPTSTLRNERLEEMGKPALGKINKCVIKIKESKEFKNAVDMLIKKTNVSLLLRTSTWREQFIDAITMNPSGKKSFKLTCITCNGSAEEEEPVKPTTIGYAVHILTMPWKIICAFIPPTDYWDGWASFICSIVLIGFITALIGDLANHFGCTIGLIDAVTAITFVAIGTSVPGQFRTENTFASHVAAIQDKYADSSITNVTGSNAVNVFLGIGFAWTIAAVYHAYNGDEFRVHAGTLAFSVTIFCVEATACIVILVVRRSKSIGGELGGPLRCKVATAVTFVSLWFVYVLLSSLESYCIISGF